MDEKLRVRIESIGRNFANKYMNVQSIPHQARIEASLVRQIEQAFLDAGYVKLPSEDELASMLKVIYKEWVDTDDAKELLKLLKGGGA